MLHTDDPGVFVSNPDPFYLHPPVSTSQIPEPHPELAVCLPTDPLPRGSLLTDHAFTRPAAVPSCRPGSRS